MVGQLPFIFMINNKLEITFNKSYQDAYSKGSYWYDESLVPHGAVYILTPIFSELFSLDLWAAVSISTGSTWNGYHKKKEQAVRDLTKMRPGDKIHLEVG